MPRQTNHGYNIVASKADGDSHEIIIAERPNQVHGRFVVWRLNLTTGDTARGDYCMTLAEATKAMNRRAR